MARYRLSGPAKADIALILQTSEKHHGIQARTRYRALLTAALRRIAANPQGPSTADRRDLFPGVRSFHIRHCRDDSGEEPVGNPVHVIFYRGVRPSVVEIIRVLHERMELLRFPPPCLLPINAPAPAWRARRSGSG
jgi:toxin ParE1/3/4